ncbi:MAG: class I SAM-dependent methyltransferase [Candidatus Thorarchaeota archaeon]
MSSFDDISLAYDNTIDWDSRLKREMPFILPLIENTKNPRVLDIASGSGRHSVFLATQGAEVIGIDSSRSMIQAAETHAKEQGVAPKFIVEDMEKVNAAVEGPFDLIICLGNSLALLNDIDTLKQVVKDIFNLLEDGESFVAQVLNFEEIHWTGFRTFPSKIGKLSNGEEITFSRLFEHTDYPYSSTLVMSAFKKDGEKWTSEVSTQKVLNLKYDQMKSIFEETGFSSVEIFPGYERGPFDKKYDRSMVIHSLK